MKKFTKILAVVMLVLMVAMTFASCGIFSLNTEKMAKRLDRKGYQVSSGEEDGIEFVYARGDADGYDDFFEAATFENKDDAKEAYDDIKDGWADMADEFAEAGVKITYGKSGNTVYYGTVKAVKAALGFPSNLFVFAKKK